MPDGHPAPALVRPETLPRLLRRQLDERREQQTAALTAVTGFDHPDARTIRPRREAVNASTPANASQALFGMRLPDQDQAAGKQ
jgi:hypothetical protein